jgi:hypothetical protein
MCAYSIKKILHNIKTLLISDILTGCCFPVFIPELGIIDHFARYILKSNTDQSMSFFLILNRPLAVVA